MCFGNAEILTEIEQGPLLGHPVHPMGFNQGKGVGLGPGFKGTGFGPDKHETGGDFEGFYREWARRFLKNPLYRGFLGKIQKKGRFGQKKADFGPKIAKFRPKTPKLAQKLSQCATEFANLR